MAEPWESHWTDIRALWADLLSFMEDRPGSSLVSADNFNTHEIGWLAYLDKSDQILKGWSIPVSDLRRSLVITTDFDQLFLTAKGRRQLCLRPRLTLWEHLLAD